MAEFLTTKWTASRIEDIIKKANDKLVLISPYVKLSQIFFDRLKDADRRSVNITLIYGKDKLKPEEREQLQKLRNLSLYFCENLHAKCVYNEEHMVITSMNMYDYSENNNREMGVFISASGDDKGVFDEAVEEAESIIKSDSTVPIQLRDSKIEKVGKGIMKVGKWVSDSLTEDDSSTPSRTRTTRRTKKEGYCIRCKTSIPYNLDVPYCHDCWKKWDAKGGNPDYIEQHGSCHTCGRPAPTSKARPQCISCYKPRG